MDFTKLETRLKSERVPFDIFATGGGCDVLFIRFPDGSELSITPSEEENPNPSDHWLVCDNANPEAFWEGESVTLSQCADTDYVVQLVRSRGI